MGLQFPDSSKEGNTTAVKTIAAAALIAAASAAPEAKPHLVGLLHPIDPHATSGELIQVGDTTVPDTTNSVKAAAADHLAAKTLYGAYGYVGYGLGYGKRSAEAEPWWGWGGVVLAPVVHAVGTPLCVNGAHLVNGLCKKKREADSEADAYYGYAGLGYGKRSADSEADAYYGYAGLGYGYGGYGYGGLYGYGKRSAEGEADAYYDAIYNTYYGLDYPVDLLGYGYGSYGYGKRSADAKPYYGYGYGGLGYGYGGYGLGYAYGK